LFIRGTKPIAENPSARMIRLRVVDNVRSRFSIFIAREGWEIGLKRRS